MLKYTSSFLALLFLIPFISISTSYAQGEIKEVIPNEVWAAEIPAPKDPNVKIYFGMERLDSEEQIKNWRNYTTSVRFVSETDRSPLSFLSHKSAPGKHPICDEGLKKVLGFGEPDYNDLMKTMENLKLYLRENSAGLDSVMSGANHMRLFIDYYVVYASKKPVTGRFNFKKLKSPARGCVETLKEFQDNYSDIIMCMSAWEIPGTPLISHRGIFRNPLDFLDPNKTYGGISLQLHAFSAGSLLKKFPGKRFMAVTPTSPMAAILRKEFKSGEIFAEYPDESSAMSNFSSVPGITTFEKKIPGGSAEGGTYLIDINALTKRLSH